MRKIVVLISAVVIAGAASASSAAPRKVKTSVAHINADKKSTADGECSTSGYSSYCVSTNCQCDHYFGSVNGNQAGKGTVTLDLTVDNGAATSTPGCKPVFGVATLQGKKDNSQTIALAGAVCDGKNANSANPFNGGYGITGSDAGQDGAGGFSGTIRGGKLGLKLSGFLERF